MKFGGIMVEQLAVFIENKPGRLQEITRVLGGAGIDLRTLSIADTNDFGILRAITSDNKKAAKALRDKGFTVTTNNLICVEVPDKPGGLASVLAILDDAQIGVEYLYSFAHTNDKRAVILFRAEDDAKAAGVLKKSGVKLLDSI